ncbi:MAG: amidohydrolase, partial [Acidobacteriota bacterium]
MKKNTWIVPAAVILCLSLCAASLAAAENRGIESGQRYDRVVIRNVTVIDGKGTPARGPLDIIVENNRISAVRSANRSPRAYEKEAHVLDGTGLYALPGLINNHAHIHDSRGRNPIPFEYLYKIWLACGITTVRDVGSNTQLTL